MYLFNMAAIAYVLASLMRCKSSVAISYEEPRERWDEVFMHEYLFIDERMDAEGRKLSGDCCEPFGYRKYQLKEMIEVKGRQGIATNGTHYFNSGSGSLYVYDSNWTLLRKNEDPFIGLENASNHLGDIGYYNGEIYAGAEWFENGRADDIQILLYDSETLNVTKAFPWDPDSGQVEVSALTVDTDNGLVWMTDWVSSNYIYSYNVTSGEYEGKLHLLAEPAWSQGIAFYKGDLYITADDGNADRREYDNLWKVPGDGLVGVNATYIRHELSFIVPDDFKDFGEIEGIDFNKETNEMLVLANRGMQIVLGTPTDFYPGYDREIHEVYIFSIIDDEVNSTTGNATMSDETKSDPKNDSNSASSFLVVRQSIVIAIIVSVKMVLLFAAY